MSDLHGDIMNIPCDPTRSPVGGVNAELAYKYGHRDARHAAAELASAHHAERAKPAEAEGPSFAEVLEQTSWLQQLGAKNKRIDELIAALSAVTAERDRLQSQLAETQANDRTAMGYLHDVRQLVGGSDFPEMVRNVARMVDALPGCVELIEALSPIEGDVLRKARAAMAAREA